MWVTEDNGIKIKESIDCIGLFCPEPLYRTRTALNMLEPGDVLEVIADDPDAEVDIKDLVKRTGNELILFENNDGEMRFLIRKK